MKFSLDKPHGSGKARVSDKARPPLPGENTRARMDDTGTSANAYLKTAIKANEAGNFRREADLIEKAIVTMGHKTPNIMRRYAAALYKAGEYRAAWVAINDPLAEAGGGEEFVARLKEKFDNRDVKGFEDILSFS